jgi:23S rRNA (guanosine2251-2'-O)-methyltransferase
MTQEKIYIFGKHTLTEALRCVPQAVEEVILASGMDDEEIRKITLASGIPVAKLGTVLPPGVEKDAVHQGFIARVNVERLMCSYRGFADGLTVGPNTALVLLGEIHDPQNVGAIIRSAAAFGIAGVLVPEHNQAQITGNVDKVSAGMAFRVPLVAVGNVNTVVRDMKERGFWIYGLDGEGIHSIVDEAFAAPTLLVLGNEAGGIRVKTRELCDILVSIPMNPNCESLNVAASAAVALYAWSTKHPRVLQKKVSK